MIVPRLQVLGAALLFSTGGAAMKATAVSSWQVASMRSAVAATVLYLVVPHGHRFTPRAWLVGCAYGATLVTFVTANKLTTAANAVFLQAAAPLYLALIGPWLLAEHVHRRDFVYVAGIALGLVLLFVSDAAPSGTAPNRPVGNAVGAASGVCWALTLAGFRLLGRDRGDAGTAAAAASVCGNVLAAVGCLPLAWPLTGIGRADWAVLAYLGVFQVGLAYVLLTRAVAHLTAIEVSLLLLLEPALSPFWAWLLHAEQPGALAIAGGALILAMTTTLSITSSAATEARAPRSG